MTIKAIMAAAVKAEQSSDWTTAARLYKQAVEIADTQKKDTTRQREHASRRVVKERARALQNGIKIGDTLFHAPYGIVQATCVYEAERVWETFGQRYTSISDAAIAAARLLGRKSKVLNGWVFWGVERAGGDRAK